MEGRVAQVCRSFRIIAEQRLLVTRLVPGGLFVECFDCFRREVQVSLKLFDDHDDWSIQLQVN